jgi:hypothetical protein
MIVEHPCQYLDIANSLNLPSTIPMNAGHHLPALMDDTHPRIIVGRQVVHNPVETVVRAYPETLMCLRVTKDEATWQNLHLMEWILIEEISVLSSIKALSFLVPVPTMGSRSPGSRVTTTMINSSNNSNNNSSSCNNNNNSCNSNNSSSHHKAMVVSLNQRVFIQSRKEVRLIGRLRRAVQVVTEMMIRIRLRSQHRW